MATHYTAKLRMPRRWDDDANGHRTSLTRSYIIIRADNQTPSSAAPADSEIAPSDVAGLPAPGSSYSPARSDLLVSGYSFSETNENEKMVLRCDVTYSTKTSDSSDANKPPRGQGIEQLGWRSGSVSRDLVHDYATGKLLVNTAGQPFETVPQIEVPAPTFSKVVKTKNRHADWLEYFGSINSGNITLGGRSLTKHQVRCVQLDEEKLWQDDDGFAYRYTIAFQVVSTKAKINGANVDSELGWDLAIISNGTLARPLVGAKAVPITVISEETGQETNVSSPVLLDGDGMAMLEANATPYALRVQAYPHATFPEALYKETEDPAL